MTDERIGDLLAAVARVPRGGGVIFRHYATAPAERRRLFARVRRIAINRNLLLVRAGSQKLPGERGVHGQREANVVSWPAHDRTQAVAGLRAGANALLVSPIFATRSHAGVSGIGLRQAARIAQGMPIVRIALGGMTARRFRLLNDRFDGWAAIDSFSTARQKRKAVPT